MKCGIYFLLKRKKVVYIGKTTMWPKRLTQQAHIDFDEAKLMECPQKDLTTYENRLIGIFRPQNNRACARKITHKRVTDAWVKANRKLIRSSFESGETAFLNKKAHSELGYAKSSSCQSTVLSNYERIYNLDFDYRNRKFKDRE